MSSFGEDPPFSFSSLKARFETPPATASTSRTGSPDRVPRPKPAVSTLSFSGRESASGPSEVGALAGDLNRPRVQRAKTLSHTLAGGLEKDKGRDQSVPLLKRNPPPAVPESRSQDRSEILRGSSMSALGADVKRAPILQAIETRVDPFSSPTASLSSSSTTPSTASPIIQLETRPAPAPAAPVRKLAPPPVPMSRNSSTSSRPTSPTPTLATGAKRELPVVPPRPTMDQGQGRTRSASIAVSQVHRPVVPPRIGSSGLLQRAATISARSSVHSSPAASTSSSPTSSTSFLPKPPPRKTVAPPPRSGLISSIPVAPPILPRRVSTVRPRVVAKPATLPAALTPAVLPPASDVPYLPPPPPARVIAAGDRLAPQRPARIDRDEVDSDDDEETSTAGGTSGAGGVGEQQFPDASFANRRPPLLRSRKPLHAHGSMFSFAMWGHKIVTGQHHVHVWESASTAATSDRGGASAPLSKVNSSSSVNSMTPSTVSAGVISLGGGEHKIFAVEFKTPAADTWTEDEGRYIWAGTKEGHLFEIDTSSGARGMRIVQQRNKIHPHAIMGIFKLGRMMITVDSSGKLLMWGSFNSPDLAADLTDTPRAQRIVVGSSISDTFVGLLGQQLWTATPGARNASIRVYDPTGTQAFALTARPLAFPDASPSYGHVTSGALVPSRPGVVYLGHSSGHVSTWSSTTFTCLQIQRISLSGVTCLAGAGGYLWVGLRSGRIGVYRIPEIGTTGTRWAVVKSWKAHQEPLSMLRVDESTLVSVSRSASPSVYE